VSVISLDATAPGVRPHPYHEHVTSKDKLLHLIESLPEDQADELLRLATERHGIPDQRRPLPAFVGIGDSGRSDISEQVDDLLADGFGHA
jgi:hypothetical protein